jgi:hypothetical protein
MAFEQFIAPLSPLTTYNPFELDQFLPTPGGHSFGSGSFYGNGLGGGTVSDIDRAAGTAEATQQHPTSSDISVTVTEAVRNGDIGTAIGLIFDNPATIIGNVIDDLIHRGTDGPNAGCDYCSSPASPPSR